MKLAIFGNNYKGFEEYIYLLFKELESHDSDVLIYQPFYENILNECNFKPQIEGTFTDYHDISRDCDFMISMGGDGTFLKAVSIIRDIGIPIIGINIGR